MTTPDLIDRAKACSTCGDTGYVPSGLKTRFIGAGDAQMVLEKPVPVQMRCPRCARKTQDQET